MGGCGVSHVPEGRTLDGPRGEAGATGRAEQGHAGEAATEPGPPAAGRLLMLRVPGAEER